MWRAFDAAMCRAALFFGLAAETMHDAAGLACYALGASVIAGMVLGDGVTWWFAVLSFAFIALGAVILDRVQDHWGR